MKDFVKEYWDKNAQKFGGSHWASWGDNFMIELEIDIIAKYLKDGDYVLDVGCGNGYSTFEQVKRHSLSIEGIDYSLFMIKEAIKKRNEIKKERTILFFEGDVRKLDYKDELFDKTYVTRVLINLQTWEEQIQGIKECLRVTKPGGTIILLEAFWEPLQKLNAIRLICGLQPLVEHDFNRYLKESKLIEFLEREGIKYKKEEFSSVYYFGSRVLRELVTDFKSFEGYDNPINEEFCKLAKKYNGGGVGIQIAYILYKL